MTKRKAVIAALVTVVSIVVYFFFDPVVIVMAEAGDGRGHTFTQGQLISIEEVVGKHNDDCEAYIVLYEGEMQNFPPDIKRHKILRTTDQEVIGNLLKLRFRYTGSDIATIHDRLIVYSGEKMILDSGISLDSNSLGVQNSSVGWAIPEDANKFVNICRRFHECYVPMMVFD